MKTASLLLGLGAVLTVGAVPLVCHTGFTKANTTVTSTPVPLVPVTNDVAVGKKSIANITLKEDNTVVVVGEIDSDSARIAQEITQKAAHNKTLYVLINSPGGSVLDGALIVNAIQAAGNVTTVCQSLCASMAAIAFSYGKNRLMVDRSLLMFHAAAGGFQGTFPQIQNRFTIFNNFVNKFDFEIAKRNGMTLDQFLVKLNPELWLDSEDAVNQHYADGYVNLTLDAGAVDHGGQMNTLRNRFGVTLGN